MHLSNPDAAGQPGRLESESLIVVKDSRRGRAKAGSPLR